MKNSLIILLITFITILNSNAQSTGNGVTDIDGNTYKSILLGKQEWMMDNLKVTKFKNGQPIPHIQDSIVWNAWKSGAYVFYKNDTKHGILYNWMVVNDARGVCPTGWHIPAGFEWDTLAKFLGGDEVAGGKMKAKLHWETPNTSATNESGFHALPKGMYGVNGSFNNIGKNAYWWSSTEHGVSSAWGREIGFNESGLFAGHGDKRDGLSIRCIKD